MDSFIKKDSLQKIKITHNNKNVRILLIQPPLILHKTDIRQFGHPIGLGYIASFLRQNGYEVAILDTTIYNIKGLKCGEWVHYGMDWNNIKERVSDYRPNIIGISSMFTSQANSLHKTAQGIKGVSENIVIVAGGAHPTALPYEVLSDNNIDYVVLGEGEITMLNLVQYLTGDFDLNKIDGIGYKVDGEIIIKPRVSFISNLDSLPFPAYDLMEMNIYSKLKASCGPFVKEIPLFSVSTSRGCPMTCIFCTVHSIWGRNWRPRSAENVVDEIELLVKKYNIKEIDFVDDGLLVDKRRIEKICDEILKRKLNISWAAANGVNINSVSYDLLKIMQKSGLFYLSFGIESGNKNIRDNVIKKPILIKHAKKIIKQCRDLNIWTNNNFILGLPGEDKKTFIDTINFSQELNSDSASFFVARMVPGSELWALCHKKGYISSNTREEKSRATLHIIQTENFTPQDLERWRVRAYRKYAFHIFKRELLYLNLVKRLFYALRSLKDLIFLLRIGTAGYKRVLGRGS